MAGLIALQVVLFAVILLLGPARVGPSLAQRLAPAGGPVVSPAHGLLRLLPGRSLARCLPSRYRGAVAGRLLQARPATGLAGVWPPVHDETSRIGSLSGESSDGGTLSGATAQDKETCVWVVLPIPEAGIPGQFRCSGGTPAGRSPTLLAITHGLGVALSWAGNLVTGVSAITKEFASVNSFLGVASPVVNGSEDYQRYHNWKSAVAKAVGEGFINMLGGAVTVGVTLFALAAIPETVGLSALGGSAGVVLTIKATSAISDGWDGLVDEWFQHKEEG